MTVVYSLRFTFTAAQLMFLRHVVVPSGMGPAYSGPIRCGLLWQAHCVNPGGEESG